MQAMASKILESVNGKIDLGFRKLIVCHVENACTVYAYTSEKQHLLNEYSRKIVELLSGCKEPFRGQLKRGYAYIVMSPKLGTFVRCVLEEGPGSQKNYLVRVRLIDTGRVEFIPSSGFYDVGPAISADAMPVACERYKMCDLKPKGPEEGFSAKERAQGAEWLISVIGNRPIKAKCHQIVNYKGGIWFEGEVDGKNLNLLAAQSGFCISKPSTKLRSSDMSQASMSQWDQDYYTYGYQQELKIMKQKKECPSHYDDTLIKGPESVRAALSIQSFWPNGQGKELGQSCAETKEASMRKDEVAKLKKTIRNLESTLSKRKKEIEELKKQSPKNDTADDQCTLSRLVHAISKAQQLRSEQDSDAISTINIDKSKEVRQKVECASILLRDVFEILRKLSELSEKIEEKIENLELLRKNSHVSLSEFEAAKDETKKLLMEFLSEDERTQSFYEDGCNKLENILTHDVEGLTVKLNVSQMLLTHRADLVHEGVELGLNWAKKYSEEMTQKNPRSAQEASHRALDQFCEGLEEISMSLKTVNDGLPLKRPVPSLSALIKRTEAAFETEVSSYSNSFTKDRSSAGYHVIARAIAVCLDEKNRVIDQRQKFRASLQKLD